MEEKTKHINELTLRDVENLIQEAYEQGFESDDGFLLSMPYNFKYEN